MTNRRPYDLKRHLPSVTFVGAFLMLLAGIVGAFIYAGAYNVGADAPHWSFVHSTLDTLRERSIARSARGIEVPADLNSAERIATGAGLYAEMCTGCHLGPGLEKTELSQGLYPPAPELASTGLEYTPAQQFWAIKHGVKLSAMPAWGKTHDDQLIWSMVAFIRQLPKMSPAQYQAAVASAPAGHDELMGGMDHHADEHAEGAEPDGHSESPADDHGH